MYYIRILIHALWRQKLHTEFNPYVMLILHTDFDLYVIICI